MATIFNYKSYDRSILESEVHRKRKRKTTFVSYEELQKSKRWFKCPVCKKKLSTKDTLRKHILAVHIKLKPHECDVCNKCFIFEKSLATHKETHCNSSLYKCPCGRSFKLKSAHHYHIKRYHKAVQTPVVCSFCSKKCIDKKQLRYHFQVQHAAQTIPCTFPLCRKLFPTKAFLLHHLRSHSEKRHECSLCKKRFKLKSYMEKHKAAHQGARPYECSECGKTYLTASHMNAHRKRTHSDQPGNYLCCMCGKLFKDRFELISHENIHKDERRFECDACDFKSCHSTSLRNHKKKHLSQSEDAPFPRPNKCRQIEEEGSRKNVPHYTKILSELRPYKCIDCEKAFQSAVRANEHWRRYHYVKKEFKCSLCSKKFQSEQDLMLHKNFHEADERFKCDICTYKTAYRIGLFAHRKTHLKDYDRNHEKRACKYTTQKIGSVKPQEEKKLVKKINSADKVEQSLSSSLESFVRPSEIDKNFEIELESPYELNGTSCADVNELLKPEDETCQMKEKNHPSDKQRTTKTSKVRTRLKKETKLFASPIANGNESCLWDEDQYDSFSNQFIFEPYSQPSFDLNSVNEFSPGHRSFTEETQRFKTMTPQKLKLKAISGRRNPNITLNSTAIDDCLEGSNFPFNSFDMGLDSECS